MIDKLQLPLPVVAETPPAKEAAITIGIVSRYVASDEFQRHCDKFREEVIARKTPTNWTEASVKLGVPFWVFLEAIKHEAIEGAPAGDNSPTSITHVLRERLGVQNIAAAAA